MNLSVEAWAVADAVRAIHAVTKRPVRESMLRLALSQRGLSENDVGEIIDRAISSSLVERDGERLSPK